MVGTGQFWTGPSPGWRRALGVKREYSARLERWPMRAPFRITGHVFTALDCVLVEIAEGGCIGRGEAAGVYYLDDTPERALEQIQALAPEIEAGVDRETLQGLLPPGGARNALDCALWDLECKLSRQSIWKRTGLESSPLTTCQTIGVLPSPADSGGAAAALRGYKLLKPKRAHDRPGGRVRAVRSAPPDARIIGGASHGFTPPRLPESLRALPRW